MTIQEAIDNYESSTYGEYFEDPPYVISEYEAFDCGDYWISPTGEIISCGYAEHSAVICLLNDFGVVNITDERDAELQGWVKCSGGAMHIVDFPVKKHVKDIILLHFSVNQNKIWLCGGRYRFFDAAKLERWLDGGQYSL